MSVRPWHRGLLLALPAALICAAGPVAPAERAEAASSLSLPASKGFSATIEGAGRTVELTLSNGRSGATYTVPGRAWRGGVKAGFGNLGRVAVRFKPSGRVKVETPPQRCRGKPRTIRFGTYVGVVRFTGERGYSRVRARRAQGTSSTSPRWRCKTRRGARRRAAASLAGDESAALEVATRNKGLVLSAVASPPIFGVRLTIASAALRERRGKMRIARFALVFMPGKRFTFDGRLATATLQPPEPFTGSATYERQPDGSATWTGDLRVSLPGTDDVALTGERFTTVKLRSL